jgi:mannose-6-phosphate isomerase-like protein (cupin superfamily)
MSALLVLPGEGKSVRMGKGLGVVFKLLGEQSEGRLAVVEHPLEPSSIGGPPHLHHREDECSYVLEGEIVVQIGTEIIHAPAGSLIYKPRGVTHAFWNESTTRARVLEMITPAGFERYFEELAELLTKPMRPRLLMDLAEKYGVEMDMVAMAEISKKYNVRLA